MSPGGFQNLTVQYDKVLYLIEDSEYSRRAIGKYIDVWHYPDGHKELRLNDVLLPYSTYDRLSEVDPVAIVDNKRLGHVLDVARRSRKRDNNRSQSIPSGDEPSRRRHAPSINKPQRSLNEEDLLEAMIQLQGSSEAILVKGELDANYKGNPGLTDQWRYVRYAGVIAIMS